MIEVNDIHKRYSNHHVLKGINFTAPKGHVTGLVGQNGAGKSTAIRIIAGFEDSDSGSVVINGKKMHINAVETKSMVGYAPENAPSYREHTVHEYLSFIANIRGLSKVDKKSELERAIDAFSLEKVLSQLIGTLSKGYRHRVSLGQCLLGDPPVIILDEPTDGLDPIQKIAARQMILKLAQSKVILLTTHLLEEVDMLCSRVVAIRQGRIVYQGSTDEVIKTTTAEDLIHLRLEKCEAKYFESVLRDLPGLVSLEHNNSENDTHIKIRLSKSDINRDISNEISLALQAYNLRIIELYREKPKLENIFHEY